MFALMRLLSLAGLLTASPALAQEQHGHIRGIVVEPDGSVASEVPIRILNEQTGEARRAVTTVDGAFAVASLLPGTYRLETLEGFQPAGAVRARLSAGEDLQVRIRLGHTSIAMEADVRPMFVPIERYSATLRTRIDQYFMSRLPLDGGNLLDVVLLAPGTSTGERAIASNGMDDSFASFYIDGTYDTDPRLGAPVVSLPLDALEEVDVRTAAFDASHGRTAGAQVMAVTRSGSNQLAAGATAFLRTHPGRAYLGGYAGGPLVADRTFLFGSYQFSEDSDEPFDPDAAHLFSARGDHIINGSARLTSHYAVDDGRSFDRRGQNAGASLHTPVGTSVTNDLRFGLARVGFGSIADESSIADPTGYQFVNVTTWSNAAHVVSAGAEWSGIDHGLDANGRSGSSWGIFVQDGWRAFPSVSIDAGTRFDHVSPDGTDTADMVSPRLGAAWTVDAEAQTVLRGGYGIYRNVGIVTAVTPRVDGWSLSLQRQIGRTRRAEVAYVGNRVDDLAGGTARSRYNALQVELEQRSELGISGLVGYVYGKWTDKLEPGPADRRSQLDSRHRLSAALVISLPFGDERRWFTDGAAATILGNMELTWIFTHQSGRPMLGLFNEQGFAHRNLDIALLKYLTLGDATLQLRAETFNVTNRANLERTRRFQFGGKLLFRGNRD
jgi:hypothetical protein